MDSNPSITDTVAYEWKKYPKSVLRQFIKKNTIRFITRILVNHTVEELSDDFMTMAKNLFNNAAMGIVPTPNMAVLPPGALISNIAADVDNTSVRDGKKSMNQTWPGNQFGNQNQA